MLHSKLLSLLLAGTAAGLLLASAPAPAGSPAVAPVSAADRASIEAVIRDLKQNALSQSLERPASQSAPMQARRRVDDIANARMADERAKVLRFLKIDPESENALYIFVSWSMPLPILRAYAIEAMWTGSTLVFRGLPPGRSMSDFFLKDLRELVWDQGASAALSVDPRLYDAYRIEVVPSIVLTRTRENPVCNGAGDRSMTVKGRAFRYSRCPPLAEDRYVKVSGAVTLDYALDAFEKAGHREAGTYLAALRRGYPAGRKAPHDQVAFQGEWKNAFTPKKLMDEAETDSIGRP